VYSVCKRVDVENLEYRDRLVQLVEPDSKERKVREVCEEFRVCRERLV